MKQTVSASSTTSENERSNGSGVLHECTVHPDPGLLWYSRFQDEAQVFPFTLELKRALTGTGPIGRPYR